VTAAATAAVAAVLVLLLANHTRLQPATIGCTEAVPVGLLLGLSLSPSTAAAASPVRAAIVPVVAVLGTAAAVVDAHERRLPNALTASLGAALLITLPATALLTGNPDGLLRALIAAVLAGVVALAVKAARSSVIGWGDVKLLPSLAAALAWAGVSALAQGLVLWVVLLLATTAVWRVAGFDNSDAVPYGPALVLGTLAALLVVT
jgi:prepilin signal peptidase PulO-like enzyme (type II secretory pathway)